MKYQITFWLLVTGAIILVIAIAVMAGSIQSILKSEGFRKKQAQKKSKNSDLVKAILLLLGFTLFSGSNHAATPEVPNPIFEPEMSDIIGAAIVDLLLLFTFIYFKSIFDNLVSEMVPTKVQKEKSPWFKLNKILTDSVEIEDEGAIMMDHEYDGIRELDNNLPPWWKWGFYATIAFAVVYLFNYHILKTGDLQIAEYEKSMEQAEIQKKAYLEGLKLTVDENNVTLLTDAQDINEGKNIFKNNCAICHGELGQGQTGPNFTDKYWIYGNDIKNVFNTIKYGTANGMQAWAEDDLLLGIEIQQVASYVISLQGSNVPGGLPPQGDPYEAITETEP